MDLPQTRLKAVSCKEEEEATCEHRPETPPSPLGQRSYKIDWDQMENCSRVGNLKLFLHSMSLANQQETPRAPGTQKNTWYYSAFFQIEMLVRYGLTWHFRGLAPLSRFSVFEDESEPQKNRSEAKVNDVVGFSLKHRCRTWSLEVFTVNATQRWGRGEAEVGGVTPCCPRIGHLWTPGAPQSQRRPPPQSRARIMPN